MPDSQSQGYSEANQLVLNAVKRAIQTRWETAFRDGFTQKMLEMVLEATVPQIAALEKMIAGLTANFLSARTAKRVNELDATALSSQEELRKGIVDSFISGRQLVKDGVPLEDAVSRSLDQLTKFVDTHAQVVKIKQSQSTLITNEELRYKRVVHSENPCALCLIASTRVYYIQDLLPIHERCFCDVDVIQPGDITVINGKEYVGLQNLKIPEELMTIGPRANPDSDASRLKGYLQDLDKRQFEAGLQAWENAIDVKEMARGGPPRMSIKSNVKPKPKTAKPKVEGFKPAFGAITDDMSWDESLDAFKAAHPGIKLVGWNAKTMNKINADSDAAAIHKDWFQGISDVLAKYPDVAGYIKEIRLQDTGMAFAHVEQVIGTQGRASIIAFTKDSITKPSKYVSDMVGLAESGHSFPNSAERPAYSTAIHEMGHVLDNFSFETVSYRLEEDLPILFLNQEGLEIQVVGMDPMRWEDKLYKQYGKFLSSNMSGYSLDPSWADPHINPPETLAEAFGDVWINGDRASATSKEIVSALEKSIESARRYDAGNKIA